MNKKDLKYVLIVSGIVLLLGLGIWGYKYIKNRNDDKRTNENKTDLKELANLTSYKSSSVGGYTLNYYYNGPINMGTCLIGSVRYDRACSKYNYYLTIYINDSIKLKSSWLFFSFEAYSISDVNSAKPTSPKNLITNVLNDKFLVLSLSNYTFCDAYNGDYSIYCNGNDTDASKTYYPYTKVFDATTGDMIFAVPTNSNEQITINGRDTFDGLLGSAFKNNMYLAGTSAIYYFKSNYTLTDGNNVEVHKVQFDDRYDNKYYDAIIAYTKGTIKNK